MLSGSVEQQQARQKGRDHWLPRPAAANLRGSEARNHADREQRRCVRPSGSIYGLDDGSGLLLPLRFASRSSGAVLTHGKDDLVKDRRLGGSPGALAPLGFLSFTAALEPHGPPRRYGGRDAL
jgi:hypothetical protein